MSFTSRSNAVSPASSDGSTSRSLRNIPLGTLTLALIITGIQILRMGGGSYEEWVVTNLGIPDWETFYSQP